MKVTAQDVLNYVVKRGMGSEENPVVLGNVEFWHPIPGLAVGLCYSIPTSKWDVKSVQDDINKITSEYWDDMIQWLQTRPGTEV